MQLPPGFVLDTHPSGPVYGAPPKADVPSGYRPAGDGLAAIPGGPADKPAPPPSGYRPTHDGGLEPIPGGPNDPSQNDTLDPLTTDYYAHQVLAGAPMPALGMGKQASMMRQKVMERVAQIASSQGMGGADMAVQIAHYKAGLGNVQNLEKQRGATTQNEQTAMMNGQQFIDRSAELPGQTQFPIINSIVQTAQRHLPVPGHDTVAAMDAAWQTFTTEYAKVVAGSPTGAGTLSDSARHEAQQTMQGNYSLSQKKAAFAQMQNDMENRLKAMDGAVSQAYSSLTTNPNKSATGHGATPPVINDQLTPSGGGTREVIDPAMTPVRREYIMRLQAGASGTELVKFLRDQGVTDPLIFKTVGEQAAYRRKHPNRSIDLYNTSAIDHRVEQMGGAQNAINWFGQSDIGAGVAAAGNAATGGYLPDIIGATGGNEDQARLNLQYSGRDHPLSALAGTIAGGTAAALAGEAALGGAGMAAGVGRSLLADIGYGALAGSGASPDSRLSGAIIGAAAGAGGSLLGQGFAKGGSAMLRGVRDPSVRALAGEVIPMTVGQMASQSGRVGRAVKGVEDRLTGFGGIGDMVNANRAESVQAMNAKAFDKALAPIGKKVGGATGPDGVNVASEHVKQSFRDALTGKSATPDEAFITAAKGPMSRLASIKRSDLGPEIVGQIEEHTRDLFDPATGALSGENMQSFLEALRQLRKSYANDPLFHGVIKPSLKGIEGAVEDMFARQTPEVMPAYRAAKQAYRRVSILSDAVNAAENTDNTFVASQLRRADLNNAKKYNGNIAAAKGDRQFNDLSGPAQKVLPSKIPDSGTAGRVALLAVPGGLTGAGAGLGYLGVAGDNAKEGAGYGLGLTGLLAAAYTKTGQRSLAALLLKRSPKMIARAEGLAKRAKIAGAAGTALTVQTHDGQ